jgi:hypothetical protein
MANMVLIAAAEVKRHLHSSANYQHALSELCRICRERGMTANPDLDELWDWVEEYLGIPATAIGVSHAV